MLELVIKILQHDEHGKVTTLAATGTQIPETKLSSIGIHSRCQKLLTNTLRNVSGMPEVDVDMLVETIDRETAMTVLNNLATGKATIAQATLRGELIHLVIVPEKV